MPISAPASVPAVRAVRPAPREPRLDGRLGCDLEVALEPSPARRLDVRRCRRAPDLRRPRPLGRGLARRDRPRASLHGAAYAPRLRLSGAPLRLQLERSVAAADGAAREAEGEREHRLVPAAGTRGAASAAALRDDPRRQRLSLVRLGRTEPALVERRPPLARPAHRCRLRSRRHLLPPEAGDVRGSSASQSPTSRTTSLCASRRDSWLEVSSWTNSV